MTPEEQEFQRQHLELVNQILFKDEKKLIDATNLYIARDYFALRITVGETFQTFAITPYLAKMLGRSFASQVTGYEELFGSIVVDLSVPSPLTMADLNKPDSGESAPPGTEPEDPPGKPGKPKKR